MNFYIYIYRDEKEYGPYSAETVIELLYEGTAEWTDVIRRDGDKEWSEMGEVFDLEELQV